MKKTVLLFSVCAAAAAFFLLAVPAVNDRAAADTAKKLAALPLPEQTRYIERASLAGKLAGNGNGMQYLGAILIQSGLSLEELRAYYARYAEREWECVVERQTGRTIRAVEHGSLEFQTEIRGDDYFIVCSWGTGPGVFAELDLRGR